MIFWLIFELFMFYLAYFIRFFCVNLMLLFLSLSVYWYLFICWSLLFNLLFAMNKLCRLSFLYLLFFCSALYCWYCSFIGCWKPMQSFILIFECLCLLASLVSFQVFLLCFWPHVAHVLFDYWLCLFFVHSSDVAVSALCGFFYCVVITLNGFMFVFGLCRIIDWLLLLILFVYRLSLWLCFYSADSEQLRLYYLNKPLLCVSFSRSL